MYDPNISFHLSLSSSFRDVTSTSCIEFRQLGKELSLVESYQGFGGTILDRKWGQQISPKGSYLSIKLGVTFHKTVIIKLVPFRNILYLHLSKSWISLTECCSCQIDDCRGLWFCWSPFRCLVSSHNVAFNFILLFVD
jgi:hypothetical protein